MKVCAARCNQCLFSDQRIVSKTRKAELIRNARRADAHFICHKHTMANPKAQVMCRGWYETQPPSQLLRIAERLNCVTFVEEPT